MFRVEMPVASWEIIVVPLRMQFHLPRQHEELPSRETDEESSSHIGSGCGLRKLVTRIHGVTCHTESGYESCLKSFCLD
jgi:hypothetical protein